jgi:hypothetical protein
MNAKEIIYNMLTENTGTHMLDSGGANNRAWQRNQIKTIEDFENEPEEEYVYNKRWNELSRNVSVFHYLSQLETNDVCDEFNSMPCHDWDAEDVYGVSSEQWDWLNKNSEVKIKHTFNTYNWDSDLSQILQGSWIEIDGDDYLLLQIHGGCDARGGYTNAKLFVPVEEGMIHEYLDDYQDSSVINEYLEGGYISALDYDNRSIVYTSEQILEMMQTTQTNREK